MNFVEGGNQMGKILHSVALSVFLAVVAVLAAPVVAPFGELNAAVIVVETTEPDIKEDGVCSLLEAFENANENAAISPDCPAGTGDDTIELKAGATYTFTAPSRKFTSGQKMALSTKDPLTLEGNGSTIERSAAQGTEDFIILYNYNSSLRVKDLTIRNGRASVTDRSPAMGGGILSYGNLEASNCVIENCHSTGMGGGILVFSYPEVYTMVLNDCLVTGCSAQNGGGVYAEEMQCTLNRTILSDNVAETGGGGAFNMVAHGRNSTMILNECVVSRNWTTSVDFGSGIGGGIANSFLQSSPGGTGRIVLNDTEVSGNAAANGGGIYNGSYMPDPSKSAVLEVNRSTVSGNAVSGDATQMGNGGGILNFNGTVTIANSTISGNVATGTGDVSGLGGGIANAAAGLPANLSLINSTLANNSAVAAGGVANATLASGIPPATTEVVNTIIAGNQAYQSLNCLNMNGAIVSGGHNLESGNDCGFGEPSDLTNVDPMLGPLRNNGGPTMTHALLGASPALNAGDDSVAAAAPVNGIDQRGVHRPRGPASDIGAYERIRFSHRLFPSP